MKYLTMCVVMAVGCAAASSARGAGKDERKAEPDPLLSQRRAALVSNLTVTDGKLEGLIEGAPSELTVLVVPPRGKPTPAKLDGGRFSFKPTVPGLYELRIDYRIDANGWHIADGFRLMVPLVLSPTTSGDAVLLIDPSARRRAAYIRPTPSGPQVTFWAEHPRTRQYRVLSAIWYVGGKHVHSASLVLQQPTLGLGIAELHAEQVKLTLPGVDVAPGTPVDLLVFGDQGIERHVRFTTPARARTLGGLTDVRFTVDLEPDLALLADGRRRAGALLRGEKAQLLVEEDQSRYVWALQCSADARRLFAEKQYPALAKLARTYTAGCVPSAPSARNASR